MRTGIRAVVGVAVAAAVTGLGAASRVTAAPAAVEWVPRQLAVPAGFDSAGAFGIDNAGNALGSAVRDEAVDGVREVGVLWHSNDRGYELLGPPETLPHHNAAPGPVSASGRFGAGFTYPPAPDFGPWRATVWSLRTRTARDVHPDGIEIDDAGPCEWSQAYGVDDSGDVAVTLTSPAWNSRGYVVSSGGARDGLLPLLPDTTWSMAVGIDEKGTIVGVSWGAEWRACAWPARGGVVDLHERLLDAYPDLDIVGSRATGVSPDGRMVGTAFVSGGPLGDVPEAVEWTTGGRVEILDRGGADSAWSGVAAGRWDAGQLGGTYWYGLEGETARVAIWDNGELHVVPAPSPYGFVQPLGVNQRGDFTAVASVGDNWWNIGAPGYFVFERRTRR
jgi:hypothetical protein